MKSEFVKKENNQVTLRLTIEPEHFEKGVQQAYKKEAGKYNIPGFRKGKAPRQIIERHYGEGVFYDEAINFVIPDHYSKALEEHAVEPVDRPEVDIEQIGKGKDLIVLATVTVKPEIALCEYKGLEVEKVEYPVTDEELGAELERTREMNGRMVAIEDRPVQDGDTLTMDYSGFCEGVQFEGGTADNQVLVIGSGRFIPGFEEQLIGVAIGEETTVNVTFPEEYHSDDLAGKAAEFKVTVKGIKSKELPALDDEFAKESSEFDTLDELKADIRTRLEETAKTRSENELKDNVVNVLVEKIEVEIPEIMVENEIGDMLRDFDYQLRYQGLDLQKYLQFSGSTIEALKHQMSEDAQKRVKASLTIEAVCKAEGIEANDDDVEAELNRLAEAQKTTADKIRKTFERDNYAYLKDMILSRKTIDFLVQHATIK